jgi:hypothetical protein
VAAQREGTRHVDEQFPVFQGSSQPQAVALVEGELRLAQVQDALEARQQVVEVVQRGPPQLL